MVRVVGLRGGCGEGQAPSRLPAVGDVRCRCSDGKVGGVMLCSCAAGMESHMRCCKGKGVWGGVSWMGGDLWMDQSISTTDTHTDRQTDGCGR